MSEALKEPKKPKKKNGKKYEETEERKISCNEKNYDYIDNSISTSKYTCITFIPRNIFEQFSKMANIYFLIIGLMQMIKSISISEGQPVIYLPLAVVVAISACKDLFEDLKRHKADREENTRKVFAYRQTDQAKWEWIKVSWKDLNVGELIKIQRDEYLPSDILVLKSTEDKGYCFIETKNLDGETNLKRKQAPKQTNNLKELEDLHQNKPFTYSFEAPNPYLYKFNGSMVINGEEVSLGNDNFILRGCSLRNSKEIIGLVSYTGHDTKIMLNSVRAKPKKSKVEKEMNQYIIWIFITQLIACFITAIIATSWYASKLDDDLSYLEIDKNQSEYKIGSQLFIKWGTWILIFTNFVPISLLVTVEMVKFIQGMFIQQDDYTTSTKDKVVIPATVQASNLNEELGQVEYIFSDKTGTLTANIMKYKCLSINGLSYGESEDRDAFKGYPNVTNVEFWDSNLIKEIEDDYKVIKDSNSVDKKWDDRPQNQLKVFNSMMMLAVCHTVITDEQTDKKTGEKTIEYNASSPDELALLNFAKFMGFRFDGIDSETNVMTVTFREFKFHFKLLHTLEFDSARKRMSVLVKHVVNGKESDDVWLYTKGADSVIDKLLKKDYQETGTHEYTMRQQTWNHLEAYANIGLRTLLMAERRIPANIFNEWNKRYVVATNLIKGREEEMDKLQSEIEVELEIMGATAIEDQLQDEVGETISQLKSAGIKIWVLTGDKIETAVNIGYSCKLLDDTLFQLEIDGQSREMVMAALEKAESNLINPQPEGDENNKTQPNLNKEVVPIQEENDEENNNTGQGIKNEDMKVQLNQNKKTNNPNSNTQAQNPDEEENTTEYALLMTGDALIHAMKKENVDMQKKIMSIADKCKAVMCCRVSPKQKQEVVTLVRTNLPFITSLAIGDGANDVNMITAAHVGIGIRGVEGQQAARSSDFAIGEFKILRELLLNHGRECYRKNAALIGYNFYKNMLLVLPQFWYGFVNGFSGASNYDPYIYQFYNIFYTSLPIVIYALFDVEYERFELMRQPKYYQIGLKSQLFNKKEFFIWIFHGVWQACVCCWFAYLSLELNFVQDGYNNYFASSGMASYHNSVLVGNLKILLFSYCYTFASFFTIFGSILFFILTHYVASVIKSSTLGAADIQGSFEQQYRQGNFWFMNILVIGATILLDMFVGRYRYYQSQQIQNHEIEEEEQAEKEKLVEEYKKQQKLQQEQKEKEQIQAQADQKMQEQSKKMQTIQQSQGNMANSVMYGLNRSQVRSQSTIKRSYTGFGFSQTEVNQDKGKSNWSNY